MPDLVRVDAIAESVVANYLYGVASRLADSVLPNDAWFRVTPGRSSLPLELGVAVEVNDPVFEVKLVMSSPVDGLGRILTEVASEMPGRVTIMPQAVMDGTTTKQYLIDSGWKQTAVPRLRGVTPELVG